jgi:hypothetical protein
MEDEKRRVIGGLTWSWEVEDGGFDEGSNLRSGWRNFQAVKICRGERTKGAQRVAHLLRDEAV